MKTPKVSAETWKPLYELASEFRRLSPWKYMYDDILFGVKEPQSGIIYYCCVIGAMGETFGLLAYRGPEGFDFYSRAHAGELEGEGSDLFATQNALMVEFVNKSRIETQDAKVIKQLGLTFKGRNAVPIFRSLLPGYTPWFLTEEEALALVVVLRCACQYAQAYKEAPHKVASSIGQFIVHHPDELTEEGFIKGKWQAPEVLKENPAPVVPLNRFKINSLKKLKVSDDPAWECDFFYNAGGIVQDYDRPYWMRLAMAAAHQSGFILHMEGLAHDSDSYTALLDSIIAAMEKSKSRPAELYVRNKTICDTLQPLAKELNIRVSIKKNLPAIVEVKKALLERHGL